MRLALTLAAALLATPTPATASERLPHRAAKQALEQDLAQRTMQATFDAAFLGPVTITYDDTGAQVVTYAPVNGKGKLGPCTRMSPRRIRCDWQLWVTTTTGDVVTRENGTSVARLTRRHVTVHAWLPDARRRRLG